MIVRADAPGKMMLLGEYAVLEGAPALVLAADARVQVTLRPYARAGNVLLRAVNLGSEMHLALDAAGYIERRDACPPQLTLVASLIEAAYRAWPGQLGALAIHLDSSAFYKEGVKLGLGSSAAISVALLAALFRVAHPEGVSLDKLFIWQLAHQVHADVQGGQGSGADLAASLYGGCIRFSRAPADKLPRVTPFGPPPGGGVLLPVFVGVSAQTATLLTPFTALKESDPRAYWQALEPLGALAQAGSEIWHLGPLEALFPVFDHYQQALVALGQVLQTPITTPFHEALAKLSAKMGAAYKVSGAGGGDIGVALCKNRKAADRLHRHFARAGASPLPCIDNAPAVQVTCQAED